MRFQHDQRSDETVEHWGRAAKTAKMISPRLGTASFPSRKWAEGEARTLARRIVSGLRFPSEAPISYGVSSLMGRGRCLPRSRKRPSLISGSVAEGRLCTAAVRPPFHC